jgi:hypothetical protein
MEEITTKEIIFDGEEIKKNHKRTSIIEKH